MKRNINFFAVLGAVLALAACNRMTPEQMAAKADLVNVKCNPEVLTFVNGEIPADITITYPEGYFYPNAVLNVVPVLVYEGGEVAGEPWVFQGEKVKENNILVPKTGATVKKSLCFEFREGMQVSRLELRAQASYRGKLVEFPTRKVADGVNTTEQLALLDGFSSYKADNYQDVLHETAEGQVMYKVNSSYISKKQLKSESIKAYQEAVEELKKNDRYTITGTQLVSYTSPEGGKKFNDKLSDKRSDAAEKAWKVVGKGMEGTPEVQSLGQDWEGFKDAVSKSDIPDKDLILRVLSMYSDPAVRESEIKNLSKVYAELKADVFPDLRRSRFVTNLEFRNYSLEELQELAGKEISKLDEEGILRLAATNDDCARKEYFYNYAVEKFDSYRAKFNLAVLAFKAGKTEEAEACLNRLNSEDDPDVINLRGLIEMSRKNWNKAEDLFEKANTAESRSNIGVVNMLQAKYDKAIAATANDDPNKPVAYLLVGKTDEAAASIKGEDARADYLRAIVAARRGDKAEAAANIASAVKKNPAYAEREKTDIEFSKVR